MSDSLSRRGFIKLAGFSAMSIASGGVLAACSSGSADLSNQASIGSSMNATDIAQSNGSDQVIVSMTTSSEPAAGFNPLFSWGCGEHVHEPLIQSTLITTDAEMNFVNDLATSYGCSDDGLTWTFTIRDDVKFTDGEPLRASDVAFTINGINANPASEADLSMVDEAVAVDDTTVELHLNKPFNAILYTLAVVGIVPEHAYNAETYGANPIGSGRYMLERWDQGQQVILVANPDYYGEAPKMKRVVVVFMDEDASYAAVRAGEVDVAYTAATMVEPDQNDASFFDDYSLFVCKSVDSRGVSLPSVKPTTKVIDGDMAYHAGNAATADVGLRKAINMAVDRQSMIQNVLNGYGTVAYSVSDGMPWYNPQMEIERDVDGAILELLSEGWVEGDDGIYVKDGVRASFDLYYASSDSVRQALAHELSNQLKEIGVEVNPVGGSWTHDANGIYVHQYSDPVLWGWGANSPIELYNLHYGPSDQNYACYENPIIDDHLNAALATPTIEASYEQWQEAQWDGMSGFAPKGAATWVWLCNVDHLYFKRDGLNIAAQKPHPHGHGWSLVNNVDQWSWE